MLEWCFNAAGRFNVTTPVSGSMNRVSLPKHSPDVPTNVRNRLAASHRSRQPSTSKSASGRLWRNLANEAPPTQIFGRR